MSAVPRTSVPNRPSPYSARKTPAPTPTGTATRVAIPTSNPVPTMALAMPPPGSPTGLGRFRKNSGESPLNPRRTRCQVMNASGTITIAAARWQASVAPRSTARRLGEGPCARGGAWDLGGTGDVTTPSGGSDHEEPCTGVHDQRGREQHERDLDQRRQVELSGGLGELVGDDARHG